jgi:hypothetical protein
MPPQPPRLIVRQGAAETQRSLSGSLLPGTACESAVVGAFLPPRPGLGGSDRLPMARAMGYSLSPYGRPVFCHWRHLTSPS